MNGRRRQGLALAWALLAVALASLSLAGTPRPGPVIAALERLDIPWRAHATAEAALVWGSAHLAPGESASATVGPFQVAVALRDGPDPSRTRVQVSVAARGCAFTLLALRDDDGGLNDRLRLEGAWPPDEAAVRADATRELLEESQEKAAGLGFARLSRLLAERLARAGCPVRPGTFAAGCQALLAPPAPLR